MTESHVSRPAEEVPDATEPQQAAVGAGPEGGSERAARRRMEIWPIVVVGLIITGIALSPFWAPALVPLLPWGAGASSPPAPDYSSLGARVEAIERRTVPSADEVNAVGSAQSALTRRVDQLEAARDGYRQSEAAIASLKGEMQQLEQWLGAIAAQAASHEAEEAAGMRKAQQELTRLAAAGADLANRVTALEQQPRTDRTQSNEAALLVALLQMRGAVEQGRPFVAQLDAFTTLARDRPDLVAAASPLAEAARDGVAERSVLAKRLSEIAESIARPVAIPPEADWKTRLVARLRSLVTIRRIDGAPQSEPEAAVHAAAAALERGDLAEAIAQVDRLTGANAEAAGPWLKIARRRLAVEAALAHLQELLVIGLGRAGDPPKREPAEAPEKRERLP